MALKMKAVWRQWGGGVLVLSLQLIGQRPPTQLEFPLGLVYEKKRKFTDLEK
jgi:hypothetical protein